MRFTVGTDPTEDDLVADLINDDESWGAITRRANVYVLTVYPKRDGTWWLPLDDAIATMKIAYERPQGVERPLTDGFQDFVLAYFHPDWRLDDPDAEAVVSDFVATTHTTRRAAVVRDIDGLLSLPLDEQALHDLVLRDYDLHYDPYSDGMTVRSWLSRTRDKIAQGDGDAD